MSRILFASSEAHPLIKTGGLGDVSGSLPRALKALDQDVRLVLPGYLAAKKQLEKIKVVANFDITGYQVKLLECNFPGSRVKTWLVDCPELFERDGGPYLDEHGHEWHDNAQRFALFSRAIVKISIDDAKLGWQPDVVHCNDWQTGLVPVLLTLEQDRPVTLFTIHNLAYQGLFSSDIFSELGLPERLWHHEALEFHGQFSFIKGGLVYADWINTVSENYAKEIQTAEFGHGLDGLLHHRKKVLSGIFNGIDTNEWNPGTDPHLLQKYNRRSLGKKSLNKQGIQQEFALPQNAEILLIGFIGRLVEQKGVDTILQALPELVHLPVQFILLGSGQSDYEEAFIRLSKRYAKNIAVRIGYNEHLAHQIEAGVDAFLMPSRFEPCGLNQLYSLRYGSVPIVREVGGLADSVVGVSELNCQLGTASGVKIPGNSVQDLLSSVQRTLDLFQDKKQWKQLQLTGMEQDFSWPNSAKCYVKLYQQITQLPVRKIVS